MLSRSLGRAYALIGDSAGKRAMSAGAAGGVLAGIACALAAETGSAVEMIVFCAAQNFCDQVGLFPEDIAAAPFLAALGMPVASPPERFAGLLGVAQLEGPSA